jgi:hypothetical protein
MGVSRCIYQGHIGVGDLVGNKGATGAHWKSLIVGCCYGVDL